MEYESPEEISWANDLEWRPYAKCSGEDTEIFYPPRSRELYKPIADVSKAICRGTDGRPPCVVREQCLLYAINNDEQHGIWGGLSHRERNALVRKAKRTGKAVTEYL